MAVDDHHPTWDGSHAEDGHVLNRLTANYLCKDERFTLSRLRYSRQQYSQLYYQRLITLRNVLRKRCAQRWSLFPVRSILELQEVEECVVIGTLYKQMQLKPSILEEYSKERLGPASSAPLKFVSEDDFLILEDEGGRVRLTGEAMKAGSLITGVVAAVRGKEQGNGEFLVTEILEPGLPPQSSLPTMSSSGKYVVLLSGLGFGGASSNPLQSQLLVDLITGHLGNLQEHRLSAAVVRVILAGDSTCRPPQEESAGAQGITAKEGRALVGPIHELDMSLVQLASALPVDIMPGPSDPANFALPQQPLHSCLLPGARQLSTLLCATNPHSFELDGTLFLGSSGQNIDDLRRYTELDDSMELLELTLRWQHMAPSAPDTLGCYPFVDSDPFIIESCPHVYFCGNQPKFSTRLLTGSDKQKVRLVCIPRFSETGQAILVELASLDCQILQFSTDALHL